MQGYRQRFCVAASAFHGKNLAVIRVRFTVYALAASIAMLNCGETSAQVHGPPAQQLQEEAQITAAAEREATLEEVNAWLKRLAGRFRVTGTWSIPYAARPPQPVPLEGLVDCAVIGTGAGVHCITTLWVVKNRLSPEGSFPAMSLYGVDLDTPGIHFLQVDNHSIAERARGTLSGDQATIKVKTCQLNDTPNAQGLAALKTISCERVMKITAPAHGRFIEMWIRTELHYSPDGALVVSERVMDLRLEQLP